MGAPKIRLHCRLLPDILSPLRLAAPLAYQNVNEGRMPLELPPYSRLLFIRNHFERQPCFLPEMLTEDLGSLSLRPLRAALPYLPRIRMPFSGL
jgi:hypothetical protein